MFQYVGQQLQDKNFISIRIGSRNQALRMSWRLSHLFLSLPRVAAAVYGSSGPRSWIDVNVSVDHMTEVQTQLTCPHTLLCAPDPDACQLVQVHRRQVNPAGQQTFSVELLVKVHVHVHVQIQIQESL